MIERVQSLAWAGLMCLAVGVLACGEEPATPEPTTEEHLEMLDPTPYTAEHPAVFRQLGVEVFSAVGAPEIKLVRHWLAELPTPNADGEMLLSLSTAAETLEDDDVVRPVFLEFAVTDSAIEGDEWYLVYSPDMGTNERAKSGATCWPCCFQQTPCTCTMGCFKVCYQGSG